MVHFQLAGRRFFTASESWAHSQAEVACGHGRRSPTPPTWWMLGTWRFDAGNQGAEFTGVMYPTCVGDVDRGGAGRRWPLRSLSIERIFGGSLATGIFAGENSHISTASGRRPPSRRQLPAPSLLARAQFVLQWMSLVAMKVCMRRRAAGATCLGAALIVVFRRPCQPADQPDPRSPHGWRRCAARR